MSGFYTFKWDSPADEVYVTGTFDGWSRSIQLDKAGAEFIKKVELPKENILYKFVVDGNWVTDPHAPIETDSSGAQNSILSADRIEQPEQVMEHATITTATPESTTAALAAVVPKESEDITVSSVAPESTTAALAGEVPVETPGADAVPGGFIDTPATEKVNPTSSEENQVFSVNPLPASDTAENPITLAPGEPVPKDIGTQSLESNVHLDKESYEAGATNFPVGSIVLPEVVTPAEKREAEGRGVLEIPPITSNMIPESSLPITSAAEAEAAKAEAEVPEIVKESQEIAAEPAEASAVPEVVEHKAEMESELKSEIEVVPATTEVVKDSISEAELKEEVVLALPISEADKVTSAEPVSPAPAAEESAAKIPEQIAPVVTDGITSQTTTTHDFALNKPVETVPEPVKESVAEAGVTAEATSEPTAVVQKEAVEEQLKESVKPTEPIPATNGTKPAEPAKATEASPKTSIEGKPKKSIEGSDSSDSSPKKTKRRSFFAFEWLWLLIMGWLFKNDNPDDKKKPKDECLSVPTSS